jgi:hypothetical protein
MTCTPMHSSRNDNTRIAAVAPSMELTGENHRADLDLDLDQAQAQRRVPGQGDRQVRFPGRRRSAA